MFVQLIHICSFYAFLLDHFSQFRVILYLYLSYGFYLNPIVLALMTTVHMDEEKKMYVEMEKTFVAAYLSRSYKLYMYCHKSGNENIVLWATSKIQRYILNYWPTCRHTHTHKLAFAQLNKILSVDERARYYDAPISL